MDLTEALLAVLTAITTASFGATQWRLARVERDITDVNVQLASKPDRSELASKPDRAELRSELQPIRAEITALRADLTQIALAVGVGRRRKAE